MEILSSYLIGILQMLMVILFVQLFLPIKEKVGNRYYLVTLLYPLPLQIANTFNRPALNLITALVVSCALCLLIFDAKWLKTVCASILALITLSICESVAGLVLFSDVISDGSTFTFYVNTISTLSGVAIFMVFLWLVRLFLHRRTRKGYKVELLANYSTLLLLTLTVVTALLIAYILRKMRPVETSALSIFAGFIMLFIFVDIVVIVGNDIDYKKFLAERDFISMQLQEKELSLFIEQQSKHMQAMEAKVHDFKNHLLLLQAMLQRHEYSTMEAESTRYIEDLLISCQEYTKYPKVRNNALRVIFDSVRETCDENNIGFDTNVQYSEFDFIPAQEICVLFMNAFDNAVESCMCLPNGAKKEISVSIGRHQNMALIKITNTIGHPIIKTSNGLRTSKQEDGVHGIGMKNMNRIVNLYGGDLFYKVEKNMFILTIVLNIKP